ncbi:MAG: ferrous iron transport protein B [Spirochaetes bacterium]|nr:ferrous iron transport protein B [Spirochaetota bacterium]
MYKIALVGQPNSGKTTIFNYLTKSNQHVGNWPGVTVEKKEGFLQYNDLKEIDIDTKIKLSSLRNKIINIVDLPGIYSLSSLTIEEKITRDYLINEKPNLIINIIDSNNIQRHLFLTFQILTLNIPIIIVFNFIDELNEKNLDINEKKLNTMLNTKIVKANARKQNGLNLIIKNIVDYLYNFETIGNGRKENNYFPVFKIPIEDSEIKNNLENLSKLIFENIDIKYRDFSLFFSLKFFENDEDISNFLSKLLEKEILNKITNIKNNFYKKFKYDDIFHIWIYSIAAGIEKEIIISKNNIKRKNYTFSPDIILLNNFIGLPLFFLIIFFVFFLTFKLGDFFSSIIENILLYFSNTIENVIKNNLIISLINNGIISGIGNILILLPYIFIMFFLFGILEDIGYFPRITFLVDKFFHKLGLHGKSFIPLILGFGCNVPAIMGTRTLEKKEERIKTILMIPLISCSGRLPIYLIFTSAFFSKYESFVVFFLYFLGIIFSIITALILNKTFLKKSSEGLIIELPPYRMPILKNLLFYSIPKVKEFLKKAGTLIFFFTILYWFISYFPNPSFYGTEKSIAGKISKILSPIFKPLNFDWRLSLSLISGFFAKELVISTLGVIFANSGNLINILPLHYEPITALSFLIFVSLYVPCISTLVAIRNETKSFFWTIFGTIYPIFVAWIVTFLFLKLYSIIILLF